MEQAERDFQRTRINFEGKIASESDFEKARSTLDGARAAYEAARNRVEQNRAGLTANRDTLSKTTVLSPIDGIVTTLRVKAGEVTVIGTTSRWGSRLWSLPSPRPCLSGPRFWVFSSR
jgi:HlyD family secretion protein